MKKRLGGRPSKLNATTRRTILRLIRLGLPYCHACAVAKISFQTFCNWRSENERFHSQVKEAIAKGVAARLVVIERGLKSKDESIRIRSAQWLLEHTPGSAEHFSRSHVELTGPDDKPLVPAVVAPVVQFIIPDNGRDKPAIDIGTSGAKKIEG